MKIVTAMCNGNRGIGKNNSLPWPYLPGDNEHYRNLVTPKLPGQNTANIKGRLTWMSTDSIESNQAGVINIVLTTHSKESLKPSNVHRTCTDLEEAYRYALTCGVVEDDIWIMGGEKVYKAAIDHPSCSHIYLTRLFADFECDAQFPPFEHLYRLVGEPVLKKEAEIRYQFELYERIRDDDDKGSNLNV